MKLSSQEEYGLRCLLRVGRAGTEGSVTISELSRSEGISEPNVAKMMRLLRNAALVQSTRGQAGGYALARPAGEIPIGEVVAALGGRLYEASFCDTHAGMERLCTHMPDCAIRSVWRKVQRAIDDVLEKITLKDLLVPESEMNAWPVPRAGAAGLPTISS
ncbi:MAG TPA: Rrf2 family transcriptional regulator [Thermoanaerobaculia bacterium]|jgi:Rrf2 family protein|nr:Rrf2 family transcriptional regulator [Thermoanaerobaculia bacterium]